MPNTIEQNLQRLVNAKSAISEAITAKGGIVVAGDGFEDFPADIATIPSGGGGGSGDESKPIRFMDYDGSIVASYTPEEFAELTSLPANPSHNGLTAQGWNWTLSDAKNYVSSYGALDVGQMYITDDGRTRLYVRMQECRRSPFLRLYLNANTGLDIDWGDDTSHSTLTSTSADYKNEQHTYASAGDYIISIGVTSGSFTFPSDGTPLIYRRAYLNTIQKIEIGDSVTSIGHDAFHDCHSLSQITIPDSVTSIGLRAFLNCYSLSQITIPDSVTSIWQDAFSNCHSLSQITIPDSVTNIEDGITFSNCYSLSQITIPDSVTSIWQDAFSNCHSLSQITIPDSVTSIREKAFNNCSFLCYIKFTQNSPPTVWNANAFFDIPTDCKILVPRGTLSAYKSATYYPSSSTYTYEEYD